MACMYAALSTNEECGYVKTYPGAEGEEGHVLGNLPISAIERERASGICKLLLTSLFALGGRRLGQALNH